jgi:NADH-quinone oxidoreductase subunit G
VRTDVAGGDTSQAIARELVRGDHRLILLGAIAQRDPAFGLLRELATALADITGAQVGYIADGGNTVAGHLAGVLPHRGAGGQASAEPGMDVAEMLAAKLKAYLLLGPIEPELDIAAGNALAALQGADLVIALSPYGSAKQFAHVILPIGTYAETSGTYVNLEGRWQSVPGAARPIGESRPAWKVLRVLGTLLQIPGFEYMSSDQVRDELQARVGTLQPSSVLAGSPDEVSGARSQRPSPSAAAEVGLYTVDAIVRRSTALQATPEGLASNRNAP